MASKEKKIAPLDSVRSSLPASITVQLADGNEVKVPKLHTGDYYQVMIALEDLPGRVVEQLGIDPIAWLGQAREQGTVAAVLAVLPRLLAVAFDETVAVIAAATHLKAKFLKEETYLEDLLAIVEAILEVNNVERVVELLKNLKTRLAKAGILTNLADKIPSLSSAVSPTSPGN